ILLAPITFVGAVGNVLSIKTFFRLGISDGVNLSLLSLAASDLFYLITALITAISLMLLGVEELSGYKVRFALDPEAVFMTSTHSGSGFYAISMLVTTFITVVRCLAVAQPLKYRNLISRQTTTIIISLFTVLSVTSAVLTLAFLGILHQFDSKTNTTSSSLWLSPQQAIIKDVIFGIRDVILPLTSQIIVGVCVVIMARYLRKASSFRKTLSSNIAMDTITSISLIAEPLTRNNNPASAKVAGKEIQVVQQMLLIAVVYSLCNMPKVVFNMTQIILPEFYRGGRYSALYSTFNIVRELIQSVNASVTIFIYWKYNSKFRNHFVLQH
ncbi:unnamed protein product, partial [Lymnaea stagnalis]